MTYKRTTDLLIGATTLYGLALLLLKVLGAEGYTPLMWIAPAFFYLYEAVFVVLMGKYGKMKPQSMVICSMIMRGVKFLSVAAMLLIWVVLELPAKNTFLLYALGFYLLTSLLESLCVKVYAKENFNQK